MIRVGTAGWSYPDWEGIAYPRPRPRGFHPLAHLARYVDCVELNSTFYALPRAEHAARWAELVADRPGFRFLAKVHQDFTHNPAPAPGATDPWPALARAFRAGLEPLVRARRLAALLLQFPVTFRRAADGERRLERLVELLTDPSGPALAVELRHRSWFAPESLARLARARLALVHIDLPASADHPPPWHEPTAPLGYLRLHGRNARTWFKPGAGRDARYDYLYSPSELGELAQRARRLAGASDETYVVTNNHFEGQALANAIELRSLLEGRRVPAPPELLARFPRLSESASLEGQQRLF